MLKDQTIELTYQPAHDNGKKRFDQNRTLRLRRVCCQDERNRYFEFLANNFDIQAEEVAFSDVASLIRVHLISMLDVYEMLRSTRRAYGSKSNGPPGFNLQIKLALV